MYKPNSKDYIKENIIKYQRDKPISKQKPFITKPRPKKIRIKYISSNNQLIPSSNSFRQQIKFKTAKNSPEHDSYSKYQINDNEINYSKPEIKFSSIKEENIKDSNKKIKIKTNHLNYSIPEYLFDKKTEEEQNEITNPNNVPQKIIKCNTTNNSTICTNYENIEKKGKKIGKKNIISVDISLNNTIKNDETINNTNNNKRLKMKKLLCSQKKYYPQTSANSRKNSNEKQISKIMSLKHNKLIHQIINPKTEKNNNLITNENVNSQNKKFADKNINNYNNSLTSEDINFNLINKNKNISSNNNTNDSSANTKICYHNKIIDSKIITNKYNTSSNLNNIYNIACTNYNFNTNTKPSINENEANRPLYLKNIKINIKSAESTFENINQNDLNPNLDNPKENEKKNYIRITNSDRLTSKEMKIKHKQKIILDKKLTNNNPKKINHKMEKLKINNFINPNINDKNIITNTNNNNNHINQQNSSVPLSSFRHLPKKSNTQMKFTEKKYTNGYLLEENIYINKNGVVKNKKIVKTTNNSPNQTNPKNIGDKKEHLKPLNKDILDFSGSVEKNLKDKNSKKILTQVNSRDNSRKNTINKCKKLIKKEKSIDRKEIIISNNNEVIIENNSCLQNDNIINNPNHNTLCSIKDKEEKSKTSKNTRKNSIIKEQHNQKQKINIINKKILVKKVSEIRPINSSKIIKNNINKSDIEYNNNISKAAKKSTHNRNVEQNHIFGENTNSSAFSTMKDSNYYSHECENLSKYIQEYYIKNKEYPPTDLSFYKYGRMIGRGAFGKVNIGLNILTGRIVAIKSFNKKNLTNEISKNKILYETNLMRGLCHPSVTKILETFETDQYYLIIMEYISGGNLQSFIKKRRKLGEKTSKILFRQIIQALKYIHSKNIVHRDIKLENILLDLNNIIKICDFGVGKLIKPGVMLRDQCGTPVYMAPEIIKGEGYEGPPVDVWSAGVALYIMLTGNIPFNKDKNHDLKYSILNCEFKKIKDVSDQVNDLISKILEKNPNKRITVDQILEHPWLNNTNNDEEVDYEFEIKNVNKYHLFTNAEMILLAKTHIDYRNAQKKDLAENFTLKNLYTIEDKINNKNVDTKSLILAPYNSMMTDDADDYDNEKIKNYYLNSSNSEDILDNFNEEIEVKNYLIKYHGKAKELNMNYELNNNEEIDNGMLIDCKNDLVSEESKINQSLVSENSNNEKKKENTKKILKIKEQNNKNKRKSAAQSDKTLINKYFVNKVCELGYKEEYIIKCLEKNELNQATTAYYLFSNYEGITNEKMKI